MGLHGRHGGGALLGVKDNFSLIPCLPARSKMSSMVPPAASLGEGYSHICAFVYSCIRVNWDLSKNLSCQRFKKRQQHITDGLPLFLSMGKIKTRFFHSLDAICTGLGSAWGGLLSIIPWFRPKKHARRAMDWMNMCGT